MDAFDLDVRRYVYFGVVTNGRPPMVAETAEAFERTIPAWWWSRLDPGWRPRTVEESQAILETVGLAGEFWALRK